MMRSSSPAKHEYGRGAAADCCRAFPWVPLACLIILVVGTPIWVLYSYAAASSTSTALAAAAIDAAAVQSALGTLGMVRMVVLVLVVVASVLVAVVSVTQAVRKSGQSGAGSRPSVLRTFMAADGFTALLLWVLLLGAVVLLAFTATWFLGSMAADLLLNTATQYSATAEKAANRAVDSASTLVEQLKITQLTALDIAPQEVKDSQWYKDFRNGVNNFNQTVAAVVGKPSSDDCQPGCISLDFIAGLAGLNSTCICLMTTINNVQQGLQTTKQATMYSLVGLLLVYLASSWLLIHFVSDYTNTRRDLKDHKRLVKSSSTGEGLYIPERISPTADAAIEIRAADSPISYKGPTTAVPRASHHELEYPFVHNAAADVAGPRDTRVSRLPYV